MNKSKYEPPDYFGFYNAAVSAYTNAVLGTNALLLEYSVTATRTMLRATGLAAPVAAAAPDVRVTDHTELARIEASLYADDVQTISNEDTRETTLAPRGKKAASRRRRGKK